MQLRTEYTTARDEDYCLTVRKRNREQVPLVLPASLFTYAHICYVPVERS